jgi:serine/threonine-protein kinase
LTRRLAFDSNRYVVRGEIHQGHFSTVYEAYDVERDVRVALKVLSVADTHRRIAESMYRKEVGALEGLEHGAIVRLLRHFEDRDHEALVIVLELVPGGRTLHGLFDEVAKGTIPISSLAWRLKELLRLLEGLNLAHERGVIHHDLKPANVLVTEGEGLKLSDFGVARVFESYGRGDGGVTLREFYTRPYAAPEQVLQKDVTSAADLHAFGVLATAMLGFKSPPLDFGRSGVREIVEGAVGEPSRAPLVELVQGLVEVEAVRRPRFHDVERVLRELLAESAPRGTVLVRFAPSTLQRARELGFGSEAVILGDLSETLRAKYDESEDPTSGGTRSSIICYGKNLEVRFTGRREAPDRLIAIGVQRPPQPILARRRQQAVLVSASLAVGDGPSDALHEPVYEVRISEHRERMERPIVNAWNGEQDHDGPKRAFTMPGMRIRGVHPSGARERAASPEGGAVCGRPVHSRAAAEATASSSGAMPSA